MMRVMRVTTKILTTNSAGSMAVSSAISRTARHTALAGAMVFGAVQGGVAWAAALPPIAMSGFEASAGAASARAQGYLGINMRDIGDDEIAGLKLKESRGAEVTHVDHDGPAGKAGLREHDVILQMNGQIIEGEDQLRRLLRETPAGRTVVLILSRDGQQQTVTTQLANKQEVERQAWEQRFRVPDPSEGAGVASGSEASSTSTIATPSAPSSGSSVKGQSFFSPGGVVRSGHTLMGALSTGSSYTGAMVETLGPQLAEFFGTNGVGVLIHSVDANSPAATAGLRAGDVVVRANSVTLTTTGDWTKLVRENRGKAMPVVVLRDKKEQTLTLTLDGKKRSSVESQPADKGDVVLASRAGYSFR
jgi:serine protease Do